MNINRNCWLRVGLVAVDSFRRVVADDFRCLRMVSGGFGWFRGGFGWFAVLVATDSDEEFDQKEEENIDELNSEQLSDTELQAAQSSNTTAIKKAVAAPPKKRKVVRSQQQALSHLAASVEQLASSAAKNQ